MSLLLRRRFGVLLEGRFSVFAEGEIRCLAAGREIRGFAVEEMGDMGGCSKRFVSLY